MGIVGTGSSGARDLPGKGVRLMRKIQALLFAGLLLCLVLAAPGLAVTVNPEGSTLVNTTLTSGDCLNLGTISTTSNDRYGIHSPSYFIINGPGGVIETWGLRAWGMFADDESTAWNLGMLSIETWGDSAHGMAASGDSEAVNWGSITTHGENAYGMFATGSSDLVNHGSIVTEGVWGLGMNAAYGSSAFNDGSIVTASDDAVGILNHIGCGFGSGQINHLGHLLKGSTYIRNFIVDNYFHENIYNFIIY